MKKTARHSKNSLFLMEMVMVLLFLSLSGAACVRIFATARENRIQTQEWIHIQSLTTSIGEIMEGTSGREADFLQYLPGGAVSASSIVWYYDNTWELCSHEDASYKMNLSFSDVKEEKKATLTFSRLYAKSEKLYSIDLAFPIIQTAKDTIS